MPIRAEGCGAVVAVWVAVTCFLRSLPQGAHTAQEARRASRRTAWCKSQSACSRIQSCGDVFRNLANLNAVSR
jgi:hypothetical protein